MWPSKNSDLADKQNLFLPVWWCAPAHPALGKLQEKDCEFKTDLGYIARPCLQQNKTENKSCVFQMVNESQVLEGS